MPWFCRPASLSLPVRPLKNDRLPGNLNEAPGIPRIGKRLIL